MLDGRLPQLPSYFEILTAQAFCTLPKKRVDIAVLEVGLGGRLDATNIVDPLLSIVTDISLDHTEWLGSTIAAIAREKAGILRRRGTMITLPQHPEANQVLGEVAAELGVRTVNAASFVPPAEVNADGSYCVRALGATDTCGFATFGRPSASQRCVGHRRCRRVGEQTRLLPLRRGPSPRAFAKPSGRLGSSASREMASSGFWMWPTIPPVRGRCVPA